MKLSSRGRYGVRAMLELALHHNEGPIPLRTVAEQQQISEHYLVRLLQPEKAPPMDVTPLPIVTLVRLLQP